MSKSGVMNIRVRFFHKKMVPECKPEWNREAITVFSRLPSLRGLQATPLLQTSLSQIGYWLSWKGDNFLDLVFGSWVFQKKCLFFSPNENQLGFH